MPEENEENPLAQMTSMVASAVALHEIFVSLKEAGFTTSEALTLVSEMIRSSS
jgi:hypothetical protein